MQTKTTKKGGQKTHSTDSEYLYSVADVSWVWGYGEGIASPCFVITQLFPKFFA